MRSYVALLRHPGVRVPAASSLVARLPFGMTPLALVLLVEGHLGTYAAAGAVTAAHSLGLGAAGPVHGRLVDRFGQTRVLVPAAVAYAMALGALLTSVLAGGALPVLVVVALVAGAAFPPIGPCARVAWTSLLRGSALRETAYALDSVVVELAFVLGPLLVGLLVAVADPAVAVAASTLCVLAGTLVFAASRASRTARFGAARGGGRAMRAPAVRTVVAAFAIMSVAFGVMEVAVPAFADDQGSEAAASIVLAALAAGSLLGGLAYGTRPPTPAVDRRFRSLLLLFAVGLMLPPLATGLTAMTVAMFVAGVMLAPTVIAAYLLVERTAPPGAVTEAFSWTVTANVAGTAAGAALAGAIVDQAPPRVALAIGAGAALLAVLCSWAGRRRLRAGLADANRRDGEEAQPEAVTS